MISEDHKIIIENQLGREPKGCLAVAYEQQGVPVVLQMRSLVDGEPFPTLYWLCSKDMHLAIARLETEGWVKRLEDQLSEDAELRAQYAGCHRRYIAKRWALMLDDDRQAIEQKGFTELFNRYGIGGISRWDKVRCLHMHVADYLSTGDDEEPNVIGQIVDQQLGLKQIALRF